MLTSTTCRRERADRVFARSALFTHRWTVNISIRAIVGECTVDNHRGIFFTIDKSRAAHNVFVIECPSIDIETMNEADKISAIETHRSRCSGSLRWFAGVRIAPRIHPWDEQELPFSTMAWIGIAADTHDEAQRIAQRLFDLGCGRSPIHTASGLGKHVFAYALNEEYLN